MKNEKKALATFIEIISTDWNVLNPLYLGQSRYARLKLSDLNLSIRDEELRYLNELKCELCLILHTAGILFVTIWIHLNGNFSTDDVIKIIEKLYKAECRIKYPSGNIGEETLCGFIKKEIIYRLPGELKIKEEFRARFAPLYRVVCIRKHRCNGECVTAEDVVKNYLREIAAIPGLTLGMWKYIRMDSARERLGKDISFDMRYAMFITTPGAPFLSSLC